MICIFYSRAPRNSIEIQEIFVQKKLIMCLVVSEKATISFFIFFIRQFFTWYKITFLFKSNRKAIWVCVMCVSVANDLANHSSNIVFLHRKPSVCESLKIIKHWGHFIWKDDTYFWCQVYLPTQGGRGHWTVSYTSSQSYIITFYFSLA